MSYIEFMGAFVGIFVGFYKYYHTLLNEDKSIEDLVKRLKKYRYLEFYQIRLKNTLLNLDNSLGNLSLGMKFISDNFMFHYGLSILYISFMYYFIWLIKGEDVLGTINMFEFNAGTQNRISIGLMLIIMFFVMYFIEKRRKESTILDLYKKLFSLVGVTVGMGLLFTYTEYDESQLPIGLLIIGMLIILLAFIFSYQNNFIIRIRAIGSFGFLSMISFLILGIFNYFNHNVFFNQVTISLYFFLIMLPILNASLDFLSLSISRYFSKKIAEDNSIFLIFIHLVLDMFFALIILLALVNFLYNAIEFINSFADINTKIPIKEMLVNTLQNPLSLDNIWITTMLISTLLPTLVHLLFAIITFILYVTKVSPWYILKIEKIKNSRESEKIKTVTFLALPSTFLALIFTYLLLYLPYKYIIKWIGL